MKVFYSWQSNTPRKIGKDFIRDALDAAVAGLELEEAERPEVDQDTQGVMGSPVIAETILKKIDAASLVVVDVTLTGQTTTGKRLCNSNVSIIYPLTPFQDGILFGANKVDYPSCQSLLHDRAVYAGAVFAQGHAHDFR